MMSLLTARRTVNRRYLLIIFIHFSFLFVALQNCSAIDNSSSITSTGVITDSQTLISSGQVFKLGFFNPQNTTNRYVGIWYNKFPVQTIVWDSSGTLGIDKDGNLVITDGRGVVHWSTNITNTANTNNSVAAELLDTGNLALTLINDSTRVLWQSFDHPTDTALPLMKIGGSRLTGEKHELTSWKGESDPSQGIFSGGLDNASKFRQWRSGPWNGIFFVGSRDLTNGYNDGYYLIKNDQDDSIYTSFKYADKSRMARYVLDRRGIYLGLIWVEGSNKWIQVWSSQENECEAYGKCGRFGLWFKPLFDNEWNKGNWSGGCVRNTQLGCQNNSSSSYSDDGFLKIGSVKVPDFSSSMRSPTIEDCRITCFSNCSCTAYLYASGIGCMTWVVDLVDIKDFNETGEDIYIRLARSDLEPIPNKNPNRIMFFKKLKIIVATTVPVATLAIIICTIFLGRWLAKRRGKNKKDMEVTSDLDNVHGETPDRNMLGDNPDQLKFFKFEELAIATNDFSRANMLGQDPIKGKLLDWKNRFQIIEGISRGILYLHRDSRLRVIHRDLKVSNILLDEDLNPKISDFGMARIFGGNEDQASTGRVVGTLGYMPPEYLIEGQFSEKSDVYSFGVLLLEVVSGRKTTNFHHLELSTLSLLGYAWQLWNEDQLEFFIDPTLLHESISIAEIFRCIQVGLLCVQESASDRPNMSTTLSMLTSEIATLPSPRKPAFTERRISSQPDSFPQSQEGSASANQITITDIKGR
ncbi:hypothetical protein MKX01_002292 [Papaver californicum]|nr:hypothetical protein MKX01_002292 [Papaver californicum]